MSPGSSGSGERQDPVVGPPSIHPEVCSERGRLYDEAYQNHPQPPSERAGPRHRTPSPMGPLGFNSWEVGVRGKS